MSFVPNIKFKTEYCLYWKDGKPCEKGSHCFFAHGPAELRSIEDLPFCPLLTQNHLEILSRNQERTEGEPRPHNYKTIFCKFYAEGQCKLGDKCTYAHERREKRKKRYSQEYKVDPSNVASQWDQNAINDYYQQYYYYAMYQQPQVPYIFPTLPHVEGQPQLLHEEKTSQAEDILTNTGQATTNQKIKQEAFGDAEPSTQRKEEENLSSPSPKQHPETPSSGETEITAMSNLNQQQSVGLLSEFKQGQ